MQWKNTEQHYGVITKTFHWAVVLLIIGQFFLGITMGSLSNSEDTSWGYTRPEWFQLHQSFGFLMMLVVVARVAWRRYSTLPAWAEGLTQGERKYAHIVERVLYWLMFLTPLFGLLLTMTKSDHVYFFGLFIPSFLPHNDSLSMGLGLGHGLTRMALVLVALMHLGLVLKHQFINKDRLMNRMLPFN